MPLSLFTTFVKKPESNWIKRLQDLRSNKKWSCLLANTIAQSVPVTDTGTGIGCTWDDCIVTPLKAGRKIDQSSLLVTVETIDQNAELEHLSSLEQQQRAGKSAILRCDEDGCGTAVIRQSYLTNYDLFRFSFLWLTVMLKERDIRMTHAEWPIENNEKNIIEELEDANKLIHDESLEYFAKQASQLPTSPPRNAESVVKSTLLSTGYHVELPPRSWNAGNDLAVISKDGLGPVTIFIESKRVGHGCSLEIQQLRELLLLKHENSEIGVIATTSTFAKKQHELQAQYNSGLSDFDRNKLFDWLISVANWRLGGDGLLVPNVK